MDESNTDTEQIIPILYIYLWPFGMYPLTQIFHIN